MARLTIWLTSSSETSSAMPHGAAPSVMQVTSSWVRPRTRRGSLPTVGAPNVDSGSTAPPSATAPAARPLALTKLRRETAPQCSLEEAGLFIGSPGLAGSLPAWLSVRSPKVPRIGHRRHRVKRILAWPASSAICMSSTNAIK